MNNRINSPKSLEYACLCGLINRYLHMGIRINQNYCTMKKDRTIYVIINQEANTIHTCTSLSLVAEIVGCHRNTLQTFTDRMYYKHYIIEATNLMMPRRRKR